MPNLNKVMLMGNLTRDPELRYLPNNTPVVAVGMAINRRWRNQAGEQQDETTFVDCEAFGRTAEVINQYLQKGRPLFIEGRLKLDQWQDQNGNNRSKMKVIIESFQFVDSKVQSEGGSGGGSSPASAGYSGSSQGGNGGGAGNGGSGGGGRQPYRGEAPASVPEDDIPF